MSTAELQIRPFIEQDWPQLWAIIAATAAAAQTYAIDPQLSESDARDLWLAPPPGRTVVAVEGDLVLGSAKAGPNRAGPGAHVGTASFMVAPTARGRGIGRMLGQWAVGWCREQGFRSMQFNAVVETNVVAVRLWQSLGFRIVGTVPEAFEHPRHGFVGLHVMWLPLIPAETVSGVV